MAAILSLSLSYPAFACAVYIPLDGQAAKSVDVIALARVERFRLVRGEYSARLDLKVERLMKGQVPEKLSVKWFPSLSGLPARVPSGRYLIGLQRASTMPPPRRGPNGTVLLVLGVAYLNVLQHPCSNAFLFKEDSADFRYMWKLLGFK
ncbi:hypothetical protein [Novosphingobium sp.]|uniref:hypothetical protein n=1 Tax=Novosphingobium sp. TaxID=1874826 RepID=UPI002630B776|nr:hypothetical protein [Novosphingobium sp.]